jgi:hypothetical protein
MFEPLQALFDKHATNMVDVLKDVRCHLAEIVENTAARTESAQYGDHSGTANTGKTAVAEVTLRTREGFYWKVNQTAITCGEKGNCAVYLGSVIPQNLIDVIGPGTKNTSQAKYYVPPRSQLIFHFYEQPENQECTAHIQVDRFKESADYERRRTISHEITTGDKVLNEPERHRVPRTSKPKPEELRGRSIHSL